MVRQSEIRCGAVSRRCEEICVGTGPKRLILPGAREYCGDLPDNSLPPAPLPHTHEGGERMFTRFVTIACLGCGVLFSPVGASAQASGHDQTYFTYVAQWAVPRSDWAAFEK